VINFTIHNILKKIKDKIKEIFNLTSVLLVDQILMYLVQKHKMYVNFLINNKINSKLLQKKEHPLLINICMKALILV